jgi:aspartyl-tRNA(Asn)/glutamyl-tRNA(Gln) amidotransferase subunit A
MDAENYLGRQCGRIGRLSEGKVLALAYAFQQATEWHMRKPILTPTMAVPPLVEDDLQAPKKS